MTYDSYSQVDTERVGYLHGLKAKAGDVFCLIGDLGTGKTAFARGFARGVDITDDITSPTFAIVNQYTSGRLVMHHFDVYRIRDISEMEDTGYEDCFFGAGVCLVEWADIIRPVWPQNRIIVRLERLVANGEDYRRITVERGGQ